MARRAHGKPRGIDRDLERFCGQIGAPLTTWQRALLRRLGALPPGKLRMGCVLPGGPGWRGRGMGLSDPRFTDRGP